MESRMRRFVMQRNKDESGVSGTGIVAEGVQFSSGQVVMTWLTPLSSVAVYNCINTLISIHGHHGATQLVWVDKEAE